MASRSGETVRAGRVCRTAFEAAGPLRQQQPLGRAGRAARVFAGQAEILSLVSAALRLSIGKRNRTRVGALLTLATASSKGHRRDADATLPGHPGHAQQDPQGARGRMPESCKSGTRLEGACVWSSAFRRRFLGCLPTRQPPQGGTPNPEALRRTGVQLSQMHPRDRASAARVDISLPGSLHGRLTGRGIVPSAPLNPWDTK